MKTICLVGGKLQGFEAAYLAKKTGMQVFLIDKNPQALIRNYVDEFHCFDVIQTPEKLLELTKRADFLLPVNENLECIEFLNSIKEKFSCPVLFDFEAYRISRDKKKSKKYFASIKVPTPKDNPLNPPYFVKPPCESSSLGARIIYDKNELKKLSPEMLIEEYVEGEVISLEIIGDGTHFQVIKETLVHIDETYDCHMVTPLSLYPEFRNIAYALAANLSLRGIMDVEAINSPSGLKVLEIDARFPSQTPTVVYHTSGINMIDLLCQAFEKGIKETKTSQCVSSQYISSQTVPQKADEISQSQAQKMKVSPTFMSNLQHVSSQAFPQALPQMFPKNDYCIYEHLMLEENGTLAPVGEQIVSRGSEYEKYHDEPGLEIFLCRGEAPVFTLIAWGKDKKEAENMNQKGLSMIRTFDQKFRLKEPKYIKVVE